MAWRGGQGRGGAERGKAGRGRAGKAVSVRIVAGRGVAVHDGEGWGEVMRIRSCVGWFMDVAGTEAFLTLNEHVEAATNAHCADDSYLCIFTCTS